METETSETTQPALDPQLTGAPSGSGSIFRDTEQANCDRYYLDSIHLGDEATIKAEAREALLAVDQELKAIGIEDRQGSHKQPVKAESEPTGVEPSTSVSSKPSESSRDDQYISTQSDNTLPRSIIDFEDPVVQHLSKVDPDFVKLLGGTSHSSYKYTNYGEEDAFPCKICTRPKVSYSRLYHLLAHMKKVHPEEPVDHQGKISAESGIVFTCGSCGFQTNTSQQLARHMKTHGIRTFHCPNCSSRFETQVRLDEHKRGFHMAEKRFKCDQCDKAFSKNDSLRYHRKRVHPPPPKDPKELTCKHCAKSFANLRNMNTHLRLHDKNRVLCYCKICNEKLSCPASLRRHIRLTHMNMKSAVEKTNNNFEPVPESELFL